MNNFEYLSKDEMAKFIMGTMSEAFWEEWLDKEHK